MKLIFSSLLLAIILLAHPIFSRNPSECRWTDPVTGLSYDYSSLWKSDSYKVIDQSTTKDDSPYHIYYNFNFGDTVKSACGDDQNVAVYQSLDILGEETRVCQIFGKKDQTQIVAKDYGELSGLQITYAGGDPCYVSTNPAEQGRPKKFVFSIVCGSRRHSEFKQLPINELTRTVCSPEFEIHHPAGCVNGVYTEDWGFGTWFIIIFAAYVTFGVLYNIKVNKKKGIEAFPNYELWKMAGRSSYKIPGIVQNFGRKVISMGKSTSGGLSTQGISNGPAYSDQINKYTVL